MGKMAQKGPLVGEHFHLEVEISDLVEKQTDGVAGRKVVPRNPNTVSKQRPIRADTYEKYLPDVYVRGLQL